MYCFGRAPMHWRNVQTESEPSTLGPNSPVNKGDAPWEALREPSYLNGFGARYEQCFSFWRRLSTKGQRGIELPLKGICWSWRG